MAIEFEMVGKHFDFLWFTWYNSPGVGFFWEGGDIFYIKKKAFNAF